MSRYRDNHDRFIKVVNQSINLSQSDSFLYDPPSSSSSLSYSSSSPSSARESQNPSSSPSYARDSQNSTTKNKESGIIFSPLDERTTERVLRDIERMGRRKLGGSQTI